MSPYLRRISTKRLLVLCAAIVAIAAATTAIALAATSGTGPKPPPRPLGVAAHDALTAPEAQGVTATIEFKNRLIDSADFEGAPDPLRFGGSGRLWGTPDGHPRITAQSDSAD